jgi:SSS family solute:Na+ symporter
MQALHLLDYIVIIFSLILSIGVGVYFAHRQKTTEKYFKGGGVIPAWAIGMSILATLISSITFLAYPGTGYKSNWILLVQGLMVPIILLILIWFVVPLFRKVIRLSAYEYFEKRFGFFARLYGSVGFMLMHFSKMGTVFFLLSIALANLTGVNVFIVLWVLGITIVILTFLGGIEAVIWLDVIQGFWLIAGGLLTVGIILFKPEGGPRAVFNAIADSGKIDFGPYDINFVNLTFIVMALNGIFYAIQKYGTDQTIIQRYLAAKSDKAAIKAALMGVLLCVPVWTLFMFIGTALFAFYNITNNPLPPNITAEGVYPYFILTQMPVGIIGFVVAALLAAAISTLDTDLNCLSAIGVEDYYVRLKPNSTDKQRLRMGKLLVIVSGLAAMLVATLYILAGSEGVLGIVFELYAIFSGGIAGMFLLGLFSKRANKQGLYFGIAACVLFTAWAMLTSTKFDIGGQKKLLLDLGNFNFTHHKYMLGVYTHIILFGVGYLASLFFPAKQVDENLTFYGWLKKKKTGEV